MVSDEIKRVSLMQQIMALCSIRGICSDSKHMRLESVHKLVYFSLILVKKFKFATAPVRVN